MIWMRTKALITGLMAWAMLCGFASAADSWKFKVTNKGTVAAIEFRTQENSDWSSNWISDRIEPGDSFDMDFGTSKGTCTVRTQIRFVDGTHFDADVDYCKVSTLYMYDDKLTWE